MKDTDDVERPPSPPAQSAGGVLRVSTGSLKIPDGIETDDDSQRRNVEPIVVGVVVAALAFIALIAWFIHTGS